MSDIEIPRKATTLTQPYASAVDFGWKRWETRPGVSHYRGNFWIHAGSNVPKALRDRIKEPVMVNFVEEMIRRENYREPLPKGALLCIVRLVDCLPAPEAAEIILSDPERKMLDAQREIELGGYGEGRFAYRLKMVARLKKPIPCSGKQGWWFVPQDILDGIKQSDLIPAIQV